MERAAGVVPPDAPPGQETGVTVSWEEICRYLDSLAVRGRQRETIQVYRPKFHIYGHVHPCYLCGQPPLDRVGATRLVNACGRVLLDYPPAGES